jgi:hypothetical protein
MKDDYNYRETAYSREMEGQNEEPPEDPTMMTNEQFEDLMGFTLVAMEPDWGVTSTSLKNAARWTDELTPHPVAIYLFYTLNPIWQAWTYVVDDTGDTVRYGGFAWGYDGEGPRGLRVLLARFGWTSREEPPFHVEGIWKLTKEGECKEVEIEVS